MIRLFHLSLLPSIVLAAEPQPLFNGKNLDGWTFDVIDPAVKPEAIWSVADGLLIHKGRPPGVIPNEKEFSNYEIIVEWRRDPGKGRATAACSCTPPNRGSGASGPSRWKRNSPAAKPEISG